MKPFQKAIYVGCSIAPSARTDKTSFRSIAKKTGRRTNDPKISIKPAGRADEREREKGKKRNVHILQQSSFVRAAKIQLGRQCSSYMQLGEKIGQVAGDDSPAQLQLVSFWPISFSLSSEIGLSNHLCPRGGNFSSKMIRIKIQLGRSSLDLASQPSYIDQQAKSWRGKGRGEGE